MLILVLAALMLSASIFVASSALTLSARRRHMAVAVVRKWSVAAGDDRRSTSRSDELGRLTDRIGRRLLTEKLADVLPQRLAAAGLAGRVTTQEYVVYRLLLVVGGGFVGLLVAGIAGQTAGSAVLLALSFGLVGYILPRLFLARRAGSRRARISEDLPDALDLLAVTVEAGLGLYGAIARLVECTSGPLAEEFSLVLTELRVGESSDRALKRMAKRCNTGGGDLVRPVADPGRAASGCRSARRCATSPTTLVAGAAHSPKKPRRRRRSRCSSRQPCSSFRRCS